jgi:hypothetical protein
MEGRKRRQQHESKPMRESHHFSQEELLTTINEAQSLAAQMKTLPKGPERNLLVLRWAAVADQVTNLMILAEEMLLHDKLTDLQNLINQEDQSCWDKYRANPGRLEKLTGQDP